MLLPFSKDLIMQTGHYRLRARPTAAAMPESRWQLPRYPQVEKEKRVQKYILAGFPLWIVPQLSLSPWEPSQRPAAPGIAHISTTMLAAKFNVL